MAMRLPGAKDMRNERLMPTPATSTQSVQLGLENYDKWRFSCAALMAICGGNDDDGGRTMDE